MSLSPYLSPAEREAKLDQITSAAAGELITVGTSALGLPIRAARLGSHAGARKILCCANIHGPEFIGALVALAFLERAQSLREHAEIWVIPCLNPDGYQKTWERGGVGTLAELRTNARGVDLNRNYPLPHGAKRRPFPGAGSQRLGDATYCGPAPLSEPETAALDALCRAQRFHASANLHSFMGTLIPARVTDRASYAQYQQLCNAFTQAQPTARYRRVANRVFDMFTGEQEDHQHHALGCWSICVESFPVLASVRQHLRAPSLFWRFNPRNPEPWVQNDVAGLLAYFREALTLPAVHGLTNTPK